MKKILLGKGASKHTGMIALVDDEDFERLDRYTWYATPRNKNKVIHAIRCVASGSRERKTLRVKHVPMASQVMHAPHDSFIIHRNGNSLDYTKDNLTVYTRREYLATQPPRSGGTSKYKGVVWLRVKGKWKASITKEFEVKHLGSYDVEEEAARAYDAAAYAQYGDIAYLNFPEED